MEQRYDFIVIGSGFGGSVAALRLAEKGYRVALLEKGKRYRKQDFPKTNWTLWKSLWMPVFGLHGTMGITLLRHVLALHGNGVGGGSLVYANQLLVPPDEVFEKPGWGSGDWKERLAPCYEEARRMLGAVPCPGVGAADQALREVGLELRGEDTFHINEVAVFFDKPGVTVPDPYFDGRGPDRAGCTLCGACLVGCREGAKNTLDYNYLYLAEGMGVEIIPEAEAVAIRPFDGGYEVLVRRSTVPFARQRVFQASGVVISGGVLGTLKLLSASKAMGYLPDLPESLGAFVRTNSEAILSVESNDRETNWNDHLAITSGIYPDEDTHIEAVRFNRGSDVLFALATLLTDGGGKVPRPLRFLGNLLRHPLQALRSLWFPGKAARSTILLVMQFTENHFRLDFGRHWLRLGKKGLNSEVPAEARIPSYIPVANEVARRMAQKVNGIPHSSWTEVLLDAPITAHILGGCIMAESPEEGVVGQDGQVFGYPNLYVADGSVVPVNLGVNPALTITALAEYILSQVPPVVKSVDTSSTRQEVLLESSAFAFEG